MRSDRFRLGAALRASGPADMVPVGCDHPATRGPVIAFVTERSCRRRAWLLLLGGSSSAASGSKPVASRGSIAGRVRRRAFAQSRGPEPEQAADSTAPLPRKRQPTADRAANDWALNRADCWSARRSSSPSRAARRPVLVHSTTLKSARQDARVRQEHQPRALAEMRSGDQWASDPRSTAGSRSASQGSSVMPPAYRQCRRSSAAEASVSVDLL